MYFVKKLQTIFITALSVSLSCYSHLAIADDTDIYLGEEIQNNITPANVLFVLDQSGSMAWETTNSTRPEAGEPSRMDELKAALRAVLSTVDNVNVGVMTFTSVREDSRTNAPVVYPITYVNAPANEVEPNTPGISSTVSAMNDDATQILNLLNPVVSVDSLDLTFGGAVLGTLKQLDERLDWSEDDAEETIATGSMLVNGNILSFPEDSPNAQLVGLRFRNVDIPSNSSVIDARISFRADAYDASPANVFIDVEKKLNPSVFTNTIKDISSRTLSGDPVLWPNVETFRNYTRYSTPNLAKLFNDHLLPPVAAVPPAVAGWDWDLSNKDVVFVLGGDDNERRVESYDQNSSNWKRNRRAYLSVSYIEGATTPEKLATGLRFTDLNIPQGAKITSANLVVHAAEDSDEVMDVIIYGEDIDNSPAFEAVNSNISNRTKTTEKAGWAYSAGLAERWTQGEQYEFSDAGLIKVIQEVVDRPGWCGGNAMSLIIEAIKDSNRKIYSHEGNAPLAPQIQINYDSDVPLTNPRTGGTNTGCTRAYFSAQISRSGNDAEQASNGSNYVDNNIMRMGTNTIGLRFEGINLPKGALIEDAKITLRAERDSTTGSSTHTISGELALNGNEFDQTSNGIGSRSKTTATASWTIPDTIGDHAVFDTDDISPVIQEIVNQVGWEKANPVVLFISTSAKNRDIRSFDDAASNSARLTVNAKYNRAGVVGLPPVVTARDRILEVIEAIEPQSSTPMVDAYYEAARYYRGEAMDHGISRESGTLRRVSHPASYTGGIPDPLGCTGVTSNSCRDENVTGTPIYVSPITEACAKNHIVLLTDGQATSLESATKIQTMTGTSCASTPNNSKEYCGRELSKFLSEKDQSDLPDPQKIITHTVAFALNDPDAISFMEDLATKQNLEKDQYGNTISDTAGLAVTATDASTLIDAFQAILRTVTNETASFAAPALSINTFNRFYNGNDIYLALFTPSVRPVWNGNIKNFKICNDSSACTLGEIMYEQGGVLYEATEFRQDKNKRVLKDEAISNWSSTVDGPVVTKGGAGENIPLPAQRKVYTYTGTDDSPSPYVALNTTTHIVKNGNTPDSEAILGIADATARDNLIQWILGEDIDDTVEDDDYRWRIADPLHSSPLAINYGRSGTDPITKLIVGTNDGGIRMINAFTGTEEWLFIPQELMDDQQEVRANSGSARFYGVDGVPTALVKEDANPDGIINPASGEYVHMYIGMRRGGSSYYALDITPSATITIASAADQIVPKFMWRIGNDQTDFARLGDSWSRPVAASILMTEAGTVVAKPVIVFGGGYDEVLDNQFALDLAKTKGNAIYIVDAKTGERIWWASSETGANSIVGGMDYAIPSDVAIFDSDGDGFSDRIYVADMAGQVWRVDLAPDMTTASAGGTKVARLASLSDTSSLANKRRFFYPPDIIESIDHNFSDSARYDLIMLSSGNRARPLKTTEQDRIYGLRDYYVDEIPTTGYEIDVNAPTGGLVDVTANAVQTANNETVINDLKKGKGWYIDLEGSGEKGIAKGITLDSKFFITTFMPVSDTGAGNVCLLNSEGEGRLYAINVLHGGAGINWDDADAPVETATKQDRYMNLGAGIPSEVVPVFQEEGVTLITGLHSAPAGIPDTRYRTYWSETDEPVSTAGDVTPPPTQ